ncbi:putative vacuolar protein sorting-associated protein TDA6 [Bienertia sinuspersici]
MDNCISSNDSPSPKNDEVNNVKEENTLTKDTTFNFPAPLPNWPQGDGFATGTIDFGGLVIAEVTNFSKVWATYDGGPDNEGATFFEPIGLPEGFFLLGYYAQSNNRPLFGRVLVGKDTSNPANPALRWPVDYALVWSSKSLKVKEDSPGYIWAPIPKDGYQAVGLVITNTPEKPPLEKVRCVRSDFTTLCEPDEWIWGRQGDVDSDEFNIFEARPVRKGKQASAVSAGTFLAKSGGGTTGGDTPLLVCLKYVKKNSTYMPNLKQLEALINTYSPKIYNHPKEKYFPSSVEWFFQNGALLYKKGDESNPTPIDPSGLNLPQGGSNDGEYWIDLPRDKDKRERVQKGDLDSAYAYYHIKPMLAGTYTDLAIWLFYPFNGPSSAKVGFLSIPLGVIGEHVGDWEHITLRISNFNGMLREVYFSQHAEGQWLYPPDLEYSDGNRIVAYASLHGHACYAKPGDVFQGSNYIGIRNDTDKSDKVLDTAKGFKIISADYLGVTEPPWLNYARKWGPQIAYNINDEIHRVAKLLPGNLKDKFLNFTKSLPAELLGEQGPNGPKMKRSWDGEESKL